MTSQFIEEQTFWNNWNTQYLKDVGDEGIRRGDVAMSLIKSLNLRNPSLLEVGCGNGWLCEKLTTFGDVTGVDIADRSIEEARARVPKAKFFAGDFKSLGMAASQFDAALTLETFSHVPDQQEFIADMARVLKSQGFLVITTQNRAVYSHKSNVAPKAPGQLRKWVTMTELKHFLYPHFEILKSTTLHASGNLGFQRYLNSAKLNQIASLMIPRRKIEEWKEKAGYGQTLIVLAQRKGH